MEKKFEKNKKLKTRITRIATKGVEEKQTKTAETENRRVEWLIFLALALDQMILVRGFRLPFLQTQVLKRMNYRRFVLARCVRPKNRMGPVNLLAASHLKD